LRKKGGKRRWGGGEREKERKKIKKKVEIHSAGNITADHSCHAVQGKALGHGNTEIMSLNPAQGMNGLFFVFS
jgi:hypothetical protein